MHAREMGVMERATDIVRLRLASSYVFLWICAIRRPYQREPPGTRFELVGTPWHAHYYYCCYY